MAADITASAACIALFFRVVLTVLGVVGNGLGLCVGCSVWVGWFCFILRVMVVPDVATSYALFVGISCGSLKRYVY